MDLIVAVDKEFGIGKDNRLLASISADLRRFKELTLGKTVVMGRKTYESLPKKPLPGRKNIVISRTKNDIDGAEVFSSVKAFLAATEGVGGEIMVIGGGEIYKELLPYCGTAYVTKIDSVFGADTFFPNLDASPYWTLVSESEIQQEDSYSFKYIIYKNMDKRVIK